MGVISKSWVLIAVRQSQAPGKTKCLMLSEGFQIEDVREENGNLMEGSLPEGPATLPSLVNLTLKHLSFCVHVGLFNSMANTPNPELSQSTILTEFGCFGSSA